MRIVVFGARGGVGAHAVRLAAEAGHHVVATARQVPDVPAPAGSEIGGSSHAQARAVDVRDAEAVRAVLQHADGALWCVGVTKRSGPGVGREGLAHVVAAAREHGLERVITISGAGITVPGDVKGAGARLMSALTRRLAVDVFFDKEAEHEVLAASDLRWTEVRAPRLVEREASGRWRLVTTAPGPSAKPVPKADAAAAMLFALDDDAWVRRSPFVVTV